MAAPLPLEVGIASFVDELVIDQDSNFASIGLEYEPEKICY